MSDEAAAFGRIVAAGLFLTGFSFGLAIGLALRLWRRERDEGREQQKRAAFQVPTPTIRPGDTPR